MKKIGSVELVEPDCLPLYEYGSMPPLPPHQKEKEKYLWKEAWGRHPWEICGDSTDTFGFFFSLRRKTSAD